MTSARLVRQIVIDEIRIIRDARIDFADLSGRQRLAVIVEDADLRAGRGPPHRPRLAQGVLAGGKGDRAVFSGAVEFVDHRPPPFDHGALDLGRTRRGGMDDVTQRGDVVAAADFFRQLEQPDEHGGHHEHHFDSFPFDELQHGLRVETRHQHQELGEPRRPQAERIGRGVIERPGQEAARALDHAVDQRAQHLVDFVLACGGRLAPHALGMAGGARGVDHALRLRHRRPFVRLLPGKPGLAIDRACRHRRPRGIDAVGAEDFRRRREPDDRQTGRRAGAHGRQQVGVADERLGAAIVEDVGNLFRLEVPVDRHRIGAQHHGGEARLEEGDVVAHQDGDAVAGPNAESAQAAGDAARAQRRAPACCACARR